MGSTPIRTAELLSGAMVSISDFDSDGDSSGLSSTTNVGFGLFGKASVCATEEQGSSPGVNQKNEQ